MKTKVRHSHQLCLRFNNKLSHSIEHAIIIRSKSKSKSTSELHMCKTKSMSESHMCLLSTCKIGRNYNNPQFFKPLPFNGKQDYLQEFKTIDYKFMKQPSCCLWTGNSWNTMCKEMVCLSPRVDSVEIFGRNTKILLSL